MVKKCEVSEPDYYGSSSMSAGLGWGIWKEPETGQPADNKDHADPIRDQIAERLASALLDEHNEKGGNNNEP